jgi:hypothetical protein
MAVALAVAFVVALIGMPRGRIEEAPGDEGTATPQSG